MNSSGLKFLRHPLFLISLAILILNDHFLKAAYPGWLTGKLSDFSGLIVFAIFIVVISGWLKKLKARSAIIHIVTAVLFIIWKLADLTPLLESLHYDYGLPLFARVADATDLIALLVLPFSHYFVINKQNLQSYSFNFGFLNRLATCLILVVASVSIMATSAALDPDLFCCQGMRGDFSGNGVINVHDLSLLAYYVNRDGPEPSCILAADVDASGGRFPVTHDDVLLLADYLFHGGEELAPCPSRN